MPQCQKPAPSLKMSRERRTPIDSLPRPKDTDAWYGVMVRDMTREQALSVALAVNRKNDELQRESSDARLKLFKLLGDINDLEILINDLQIRIFEFEANPAAKLVARRPVVLFLICAWTTFCALVALAL